MEGVFLNLLPKELISSIVEKVQTWSGAQPSASEKDRQSNELNGNNDFCEMITYLLAQLSNIMETKSFDSSFPKINLLSSEVSGEGFEKSGLNSIKSMNLVHLLPVPMEGGERQTDSSGENNMQEVVDLGNILGGKETTLGGEETNIEVPGEALDIRGIGDTGISDGNLSSVSEVDDALVLPMYVKEEGEISVNNNYLPSDREVKPLVKALKSEVSDFGVSNLVVDNLEDKATLIKVAKLLENYLSEKASESQHYVENHLGVGAVQEKTEEKGNNFQRIGGDLVEDEPNPNVLSPIHTGNGAGENAKDILIKVVSAPQIKDDVALISISLAGEKERADTSSDSDVNSVLPLRGTGRLAEFLTQKEVKVVDRTIEILDYSLGKATSNREIISSVVDSIQLLRDGEIKSILVRLKPESLGEVNIKVSHVQGDIAIRLSTSSQDVQKLLLGNVQQLKDFLKQDGVAVQEIQVVYSGVWSEMANLHSGMRFQSSSADGSLYPEVVIGNKTEQETHQLSSVQETYYSGNINLLA